MEFTTHLELHSQTTRLVEGASHGVDGRPGTGFSPSMSSYSKESGPVSKPKLPLQITTQALKVPDFKSELLPLHSPLLRQSLLVSFPPLIDMLKFSGYSYLIRGQIFRSWGFNGRAPPGPPRARCNYYARGPGELATRFQGLPFHRQCPITKPGLRVEMTLEQACPPEYQRAQCAFKDSMIH